MQPRRALVPGAAAIAVALAGPVGPAAARPTADLPAPHAVTPPDCGGPAAAGFPIRSRLYGGPATYTSGGAARSFVLELRNTTTSECRQVHPLVVIVDGKGSLTPHRFTLEYAQSGSKAWRPVPFETTSHAEDIGLPGGENGPGLAVPARATVTFRMRLRFAGGTAPDRVVASATTMQRRGADGAWVGESDHYAFDVVAQRPVLAATGVSGRRARLTAVLGALASVLVVSGAVLAVVVRRRSRD